MVLNLHVSTRVPVEASWPAITYMSEPVASITALCPFLAQGKLEPVYVTDDHTPLLVSNCHMSPKSDAPVPPKV